IAPLLTRPTVTARRDLPVPGGARIGAVLADEHRARIAALTEAGQVVVLGARDGRVVQTTDLLTPAPALVRMAAAPESHLLAGAPADGRVVLAPVQFETTFNGAARETSVQVGTPVVLTLDPAGRPLASFAAQLDASGNVTAAAALASGALAIVRR